MYQAFLRGPVVVWPGQVASVGWVNFEVFQNQHTILYLRQLAHRKRASHLLKEGVLLWIRQGRKIGTWFLLR
jgi:hypothetical protein